jgi:hypothetical protein
MVSLWNWWEVFMPDGYWSDPDDYGHRTFRHIPGVGGPPWEAYAGESSSTCDKNEDKSSKILDMCGLSIFVGGILVCVALAVLALL